MGTAENVEETIRKLLSQDARGLEVHICSLLSDLRKQTVQAVLQAQEDVPLSEEGREEVIREQARQSSLPAQTLAMRMGQGDQVAAVKACQSRWRRHVGRGCRVVF